MQAKVTLPVARKFSIRFWTSILERKAFLSELFRNKNNRTCQYLQQTCPACSWWIRKDFFSLSWGNAVKNHVSLHLFYLCAHAFSGKQVSFTTTVSQNKLVNSMTMCWCDDLRIEHPRTSPIQKMLHTQLETPDIKQENHINVSFAKKVMTMTPTCACASLVCS